ncbi:MAG: hypothetical protein ABJD24_05055, partial [Acidimicrobiales bacterium]
MNRDESVLPAKDEADEKFPRYINRDLIRCPLTYVNRRRPNSDEALATMRTAALGSQPSARRLDGEV